MNRFMTAALTLPLFLAAPALAQDMPPPGEVKTAPEFVMMAGVGNNFEVLSSELALERTDSEAIVDFAQQMVADHDKAAVDMTAALEASPLDLLPPAGLDAAHQERLDALAAAEGEAFDQLYIDAQVAAHDEAVALFTSYAEGGDDEALVAFAAATLPTLKMHQEHVHMLAE